MGTTKLSYFYTCLWSPTLQPSKSHNLKKIFPILLNHLLQGVIKYIILKKHNFRLSCNCFSLVNAAASRLINQITSKTTFQCLINSSYIIQLMLLYVESGKYLMNMTPQRFTAMFLKLNHWKSSSHDSKLMHKRLNYATPNQRNNSYLTWDER